MIAEKLKKNKISIIAAVVVIAFAVMLYVFMHPQKTEDPMVSPDKLVEFEGTELEEKKEGQLVWKLTADKIQIDPDTQIMYFTNPKALVIAEDGTQMTITSDKGVVDRQKRTIEIKPPVKAETDKGDTLQTDGSVYYNMDTRMIKGGKVVMDRHDKTSLKADAFETDSSDQRKADWPCAGDKGRMTMMELLGKKNWLWPPSWEPWSCRPSAPWQRITMAILLYPLRQTRWNITARPRSLRRRAMSSSSATRLR